MKNCEYCSGTGIVKYDDGDTAKCNHNGTVTWTADPGKLALIELAGDTPLEDLGLTEEELEKLADRLAAAWQEDEETT